MLSVLANPTYRRLFAAQVLSLLGTGLTTVALGLLAWELAGADAGLVLGTALTIKMIAYVGIAPIAGALAGRFPRRPRGSCCGGPRTRRTARRCSRPSSRSRTPAGS